jgi:MYXO-CTERM domain-containing protein
MVSQSPTVHSELSLLVLVRVGDERGVLVRRRRKGAAAISLVSATLDEQTHWTTTAIEALRSSADASGDSASGDGSSGPFVLSGGCQCSARAPSGARAPWAIGAMGLAVATMARRRRATFARR